MFCCDSVLKTKTAYHVYFDMIKLKIFESDKVLSYGKSKIVSVIRDVYMFVNRSMFIMYVIFYISCLV